MMGVAQQLGLFGAAPNVFVDGESGRIAYYPALLSPVESAELFTFLERNLQWSKETMWMYDRTVDVPRLIARFAPGVQPPHELASVQQRAEIFLEAAFNAVSVQYYRNENDSVAWHNDHRDELVDFPTIAIVSLGATREMLIRSKEAPRRSFSVDLYSGSLFVMSGRSQEFWEHTIPKVSRPIDPRVSIALRQLRRV